MTSGRVLCVDDEPAVLAALARNLRHHFHVDLASSGSEALALLDADGDYDVIVSDMMMPGMNGAEFLRLARERRPDSVRVLLTGHADATLAAAAVNDGAIARYLTKPCPSDELVATLRECTEARRRAVVERDVLERTLAAAIGALSQTLALASPDVFARTARAQQIMGRLLPVLDPAERWSTEIAVPLSQLGAVALHGEWLDRWAAGASLSDLDRTTVQRMQTVSTTIVDTIPRLEVTAQVIRDGFVVGPPVMAASLASAALWSSFELDALETRGMSRAGAALWLRDRLEPAHRCLVEGLVDVRDSHRVERISILALADGMVLAQDVRSDADVLLVGRGSIVTPALVARLQSYGTIGGSGYVHIEIGAEAR